MERDKTPQPEGKLVKQWLDAIQQDSWQLELLISGFVLFLLIGGYGPIHDLEYDVILLLQTEREYGFIEVAYYLLRTAYLSLILCLIVHVVLRGVWIAAVGLRSVSGDIEYDALRLQNRFRNRLKRRLGSFDDYISRLERNCSVVFSLAFLIIFCFISLATWLLMFFGFVNGIYWIAGKDTNVSPDNYPVLLVLILFILFSGLIYLLDFITLGFLKRNRWTARPYYYIYVFMGWVTLARFYRPLYYNLVDNRFGRRLAYAIPVIIVGILMIVSVKHEPYDFFPYRIGDGSIWLDSDNYDDERGDRFARTWRLSLASRYAKNNYVQAFVPYIPDKMNDRLRLIDPSLEVTRYSGFRLEGAIGLGEHINNAADEAKTLAAFRQLFRLSVNDSLYYDLSPLFQVDRSRRQAGVAYMIPVHHLPPGRHTLKFQSRIIQSDTLSWSGGRKVYFYK